MIEQKDEFFGKEVVISGEVLCKDGTTFEDYTWEEHLHFLGYAISGQEKNER